MDSTESKPETVDAGEDAVPASFRVKNAPLRWGQANGRGAGGGSAPVGAGRKHEISTPSLNFVVDLKLL